MKYGRISVGQVSEGDLAAPPLPCLKVDMPDSKFRTLAKMQAK